MSKRLLSRRTLGEISDAWNAGQLGNSSTTFQRPQKRTILIYNASGSLMSAGQVVVLSGFPSSLTYANAVSRVMNNNIVLSATTASSDSAVETLAIVQEPIAAGTVGRALADVFYSAVTFSDTAHQYCDSSMASSESSSTFHILARSSYSSSTAICALARVGGGGTADSITVVTDVTWALNSASNLIITLTTETLNYLKSE